MHVYWMMMELIRMNFLWKKEKASAHWLNKFKKRIQIIEAFF